VKDLLLFQSMQRGAADVAPLEPDYPFEATEVFDEPGFPRLHFVEREYSHDWTNWWIPNRACAEAMLRSAGFEILEHPEDEVYLCRRGTRGRSSGAAPLPRRKLTAVRTGGAGMSRTARAKSAKAHPEPILAQAHRSLDPAEEP
jgi:tRNA (mo5U34)-methyltransferase